MPAYTPEEVYPIFAKHFSDADIDALLSMYEPDAAMAPQPGQLVSGPAAIREALNAFLGLNGQFNMEPAKVILARDIALLFANWTLSGKDPQGNAVNLAGQTSDVVRRQEDGTWLFVVDSPFGASGAGA